MEATQAQLLSLLDGKKQFVVPIYQRTYSWTSVQCEKLLDDIQRVGADSSQLSHFIGSIVYFNPSSAPVTSVPELLVIDGQQRLTTVSLLLLAITHFLKKNDKIKLDDDESWEEIQETYLVNKHRKDDTKFKLLLTRKDKETFTNLINEIANNDTSSKRVQDNYQYFVKNVNKENIKTVYAGVKKLIIVDVILERDKDNPQLIFESLNSTGLDLSQADLIRNFILMGQPAAMQTALYEKYWYPMEQAFGESIGYLPYFIRDYLTLKESAIPNINHVYETFKGYLRSSTGPSTIEESLKSLYRYANYYVRIALLKETDPQLLKRIKEIQQLRIDVSYPLLIGIYGDYEDGLITLEEFVEATDIVKNYVFRRAICGVPTNSLNKTFASLYKKIKRETYLESIKAAFLLMDGYRRFPNDIEFEQAIVVKDIYSFRSRNYLLESLENFRRKELVNAENYTIEHILPQNENVSEGWKAELGPDWENVRDKYLHTLGNLTLTGYNSELSDRPFKDKRTIAGGFDTSPLHLNETVRMAAVWNEEAITKRANVLAVTASKIWTRPELIADRLEIYKDTDDSRDDVGYNLDQYDYLTDDLLDLYNHFEKRVLNMDASVRVEFKKLYIAFKSQTNFVDVVPQKKRLRLSLNMEFDKIKDPLGICKNVSGLGRWGNGDVEVGLDNLNDLDAVMELVQQSFEQQVEPA